MKPATLVATLGSEPQVVTIALALLRQRSVDVRHVMVIHTDASREPTAAALARLEPALRADGAITWETVEIRLNGAPLADIENEAGSRATFKALFDTCRVAKRTGLQLHLCIAGGRKIMAVYGMTTAQLLFDTGDQLWHLVSFGRILIERRLYPQPDDQVALVPIPVVPAMPLPTAVTGIDALDDPDAALRLVADRRSAEIDTFLSTILTRRERQVALHIARHPDETYAQWAAALHISLSTLKTHVEHIYEKARTYFGLDKVGKTTLTRILQHTSHQ